MKLKKHGAGISLATGDLNSKPQETSPVGMRAFRKGQTDTSDPDVGLCVDIPKSLRSRLKMEATTKDLTMRQLVIEILHDRYK